MNDLTWPRLAVLGLALGVAGCPTDDDVVEDSDTEESDPGCTSGIGATTPTQNATGVYYRSTFVVNFTEPEAQTATFTLADSSGADVALGTITWSGDGKQAYFQAAAPLTPSTAYTLSIDFSCADGTPSELAFTTGATGAAVDSEAFLGETYGIDLSTATIVEPAGVNSLLGSLLGQLEDVIAIVPTELDGNDLFFFGGLASATGEQDECQTTITFDDAADFSGNPYFQILAPDGLDLVFEGIEISLLELDLSGAFTPSADAIEGITLAAAIDTRGLIDILGDQLGGAEGDDAVCNLVSTFTSGAVSCEECPGGGNFCLSLVATGVRADLETWDLHAITQEDIDANEACAAQ